MFFGQKCLDAFDPNSKKHVEYFMVDLNFENKDRPIVPKHFGQRGSLKIDVEWFLYLRYKVRNEMFMQILLFKDSLILEFFHALVSR